jgi:hypothetical protein
MVCGPFKGKSIPFSSLSLVVVEIRATKFITNDPEAAVSWATISDPLLIKERLLARNIANFGQAQGTLFTTQHLQEMFGYSGVNDTVKKLLQGDRTSLPELQMSPRGPLY